MRRGPRAIHAGGEGEGPARGPHADRCRPTELLLWMDLGEEPSPSWECAERSFEGPSETPRSQHASIMRLAVCAKHCIGSFLMNTKPYSRAANYCY